MTRRQTLGIGLVAMLTLAASAPTAPAQVRGSYPYRSTGYPSAYARPMRYQAPGWATRYRETPDQIETYFARKFKNIELRYKLYTSRVRARLERDTELMNMREEYADTIQWNRQRAERFRQQRTPERLAASTYDPSAGVIAWPPRLREDARLASSRAQVEALFAQRARDDNGPGSGHYAEVIEAVRRMEATLLTLLRRHEVDGTTYAAEKRFLESLAYEAGIPARSAAGSLAAKRSSDPNASEPRSPGGRTLPRRPGASHISTGAQSHKTRPYVTGA